MAKPGKKAIEARAAAIALDDLIVGGNPVPDSGISADDLVGGQPVDPEALKLKVAEHQLVAEAEDDSD